ncbi:hypothetical protein SAMN06297387_10256 [Streptomyces zhaozhouensis]|uniref:Phage r1t holin n=1 Tax=Streptomyces zhaozhouensis TaxID=1300267 RepID=A0A286DNW0_9ACTN|nr:hypothetical protein [Streptomyces zhaozhouensis]SOD60224.1 hypothetical protein SAMN06297387_10256 [Streptomyces zhaozhouensis]
MSNPFPSARTARRFVVDLAERVLATFVVALGGVFVAAEAADMFTVSFWEGAATACTAAAGSLVEGLLARLSDNPDSASTASRV